MLWCLINTLGCQPSALLVRRGKGWAALLLLAPRWLLWRQSLTLGPVGNGDQCPGTSEVQTEQWIIQHTTKPSPGRGSVPCDRGRERGGDEWVWGPLSGCLWVSPSGSGVRDDQLSLACRRVSQLGIGDWGFPLEVLLPLSASWGVVSTQGAWGPVLQSYFASSVRVGR